MNLQDIVKMLETSIQNRKHAIDRHTLYISLETEALVQEQEALTEEGQLLAALGVLVEKETHGH